MPRVGAPVNKVQGLGPKGTEVAAPRPVQVFSGKGKVASQQPGYSNVSDFRSASGRAVSGSFGQAPSGAQRLSANDLGVLAQDQGNTNACGTTSLANVMTYWGQSRTHVQIDREIRPFDIPTAPDKLVEYARAHGLRADIKIDAGLNDIARMVDQGVPPIVLLDPDGDENLNLHYVTVTGYNRGADGKISNLVIADSAGGNRNTLPVAEFQSRWGDLKLKGMSIGLNNVMITALPRNGRVIGGDGAARQASDIQLPSSSWEGKFNSLTARGLAYIGAESAGVAEAGIGVTNSLLKALKDSAQSLRDDVMSIFR